MIRALAIVIGTLLLSCATSRPMVGPDGSEDQLITCPAVEYCYDKAREVCAGTYKIVNTTSETSGMGGSTDTVVKMLVKCSANSVRTE